MKKIVSVLLLTVMMCLAAVPAFATDASFTVNSDEEYDYLYFEMSVGNSSGSKFCDGYGFVIYEFPIAETDTYAQLSWHIRNQFSVSVSNVDPDDPDTFTVIHEAEPTDDEIANGVGNWGDYGSDFITVHDLSAWCVDNPTGKIWVQMADADPTNGWGGFIYDDVPVTFYSGSEPAPEVEQMKTKEDYAAETLAQFNFAESTQYFVTATESETPFIYKTTGAIDGSFNRFNDGSNCTIYQFDVKAADTQALLHLALNNQYDVRATMGDPEDIEGYTSILVAEPNEEEAASGAADWGSRVVTEDVLDENGEVVETNTTYPVMDIDLSSVLNGTDGKLYVYIGDATPENGWGGMVCFNYPVAFSTSGAVFADGAAEVATEEVVADEATTEEVVEAPDVEEEVVVEEVVAAPQTFDAAVAVVLAVVTAFGGALVSKKH